MMLNVFLDGIRDMIYGDAFTAPTHIAIGTGTSHAAASDTALATEIFPDGANRSAISARTKPVSKKVRLQMLIGVGEANGNNLSEFGATNASTGGTFMNRIVITSTIPKTAAYQLKVQIQTTVSNIV